MAICRYFQQGNCKFGNNCRYEHSYGGSGTSIFNRSKPAGGQQQYSTNNYFTQHQSPQPRSNAVPHNMGEIMQMVVTELMQSEQGHQWPLSCFSPFKEQACFPGLEDHCPEELRWLIYESVKLGNLEECKNKIKELFERNKLQKKYLMNPSAEVYSIIEKLFKGEKIESVGLPFAQPSSTGNVFAPGNNILQSSGTPSGFTFALPQTDNVVERNISSFGAGASPQVFSTPGASVTHTGSVFNIPMHSGVQGASIFGGSSQRETPPTNVLGNVPQSTNVIQQPTAYSPSPFNNQNRGTFGTGTTWNQSDKLVDNSVYTPMSELSEEEKAIFNSKTFTMGKVPSKAPSKELCC